MKNLLLFFIVLSTAANAQVRDKNVHFGILITGNGTMFNSDPSIGTIIPDMGYGGSAFLRLRKKAVFVEFEVGYMQHNIIVEPVYAVTKVSTNYSLAGLDLTGLLGWRVAGLGSLGNFRLFAGLNYGNYSKVSIKSNGAQQNDSSVNTGNTGIVGGLGVDLWKIVLNIKYIHGISNITNTSDQTIKSQCASVSIGFKF